MRERKTGRLLALLLVAALLLSLLPATVLAVEPGAATTSNSHFMRIVHLDCGRKYFTVKWVESLIDAMAENGYTHLELAFGNDGLRFLLDDMSVTVGDKEYTNEEVTNAIKAGNTAYTTASTGEWDQKDMDAIISYANGKGISIIPLLNTPGHMNAIVSAMGQLDISNAGFTPAGYTTSKNTIDLENSPAVAFTQALVKKYVDYFKSKNCDYFNLGADEYANDSLVHYSGMGFGYLSDNNLYSKFVTYVNTLVDYVTSQHMTPIVFNDGVCYNNVASPTISNNVLVSYWSCGWSGYDVAPASSLRGQGYSLINTHGNFYYVLKSNQSSDPDMWHNSTDNATDAASWNNNTFMARDGQPNISDPVGSMFCIWCDEPGVESEDTIAKNVINGGILYNMAVAMGSTVTTPPTDTGSGEGVPITLTVGQDYAIEVDGQVTYTGAGDSVASASVQVNEHINTDPSTWQRISNLSELESGKRYVIAFNNKALKNDAGTQPNIPTDGDTLVTTPSVDIQFVIEKYGDYYTLRGVGNNQYLYPYANWKYVDWDYSLEKSGDPVNVAITKDTEPNTFHIAYNRELSHQGIIDTYTTTPKIDLNRRGIFGASENGNELYLYKEIPGESTTTYTSTITFTGNSVGTTSLEIGGVRYDITVTAEDLSRVTPLTVEYWITNSRTTEDNGNTYKNINATDPGVYSSDGIELADLLPEYTNKDGRQVLYWQSRLLDKTIRNSGGNRTEEQTTESGDDETFSGSQITKVRYWQGTWSVYTDDGSWVDVETKHQLVAYYLEILPVAKELFVTAADWGKKGDGSTSGDYTDLQNPCTISVQVIYEDNSKNPASTSAEDLASRTIVYNYWEPSRGIGTLNLKGLEGYQIWKIEAETGEMSGFASPSHDSYGTYTVKSFQWDNNTKTVYDGDPVDSFVIHNNAKSPSSSPDYYQNLQWDESKEAILIKVYVKAPVTEDSLTVHYRVNGTNVEFYKYSINVRKGTLFDPQIKLNESTPIGPLDNGTVNNVFDEPQTVTSDLKTMSEIGAQYRYSNFECVKVERSDDGKDVYLYYTFENTHDFVIDFGLPLTISAQDLGLTEVVWGGATVNKSCSFGSASIDTSAKTITYTPNKVLTTADTITLTFTDVNGGTVSHQIFIYPASNVLYEETFLTVDTVKGTDGTDWTVVNERGSEPLPVQSNDQKALYGFDSAYAGNALENSMKTSWEIDFTEIQQYSKYLTTSFYGNAFDLIGTAGPDTGYVYIYLEGEKGTIVIIDTSYVDGKGTTLYQVPLAHVELTEGTYTAYIRAGYRAASGGSSAAASRSAASTFSLMSASSPLDEVYEVLAEFERDGFVIDDVEFVSVDENSVLSESADAQVSLFSVPANNTETTAAKSALARPEGTTVTIDGFRVYREAIDSNFAAAYAQAGENEFEYINILDAVLNPNGDNENFESFAYVEGDATGYNQADYEKSGGPQNELYLKAGRGVVIKVGGQGAAQFSARAVTGSCDFSVLVDGVDAKPYTANHNTELYYAAPGTGVITIVNTSETNMLALGNLKILGDATVSTLSAEDVQTACLMLASAFPVAPGDTEEPEVPVEPETPAVFEPSKLDVKVKSTNILFNKLVTVTVSASSDVDKLTINGKTLYPTNSLLVQWGLSKTYTYIYVDTVKRSESKSYEIVAYNDAGLASAPVTVQG